MKNEMKWTWSFEFPAVGSLKEAGARWPSRRRRRSVAFVVEVEVWRVGSRPGRQLSEKTETNSTTLVPLPPRLKKTYSSFWELFAVYLSIAQGTNQSTTSNLKPNTNVGTKMIQVKHCISLTDARKSCCRNFRHPLQDMKELKTLKSNECVLKSPWLKVYTTPVQGLTGCRIGNAENCL